VIFSLIFSLIFSKTRFRIPVAADARLAVPKL